MANEYTVERIAAEIVADASDAARALDRMEKKLERLSKDRTSEVSVEVDEGDLKKTDKKIDHVARDRRSTVHVSTDKKSTAKAIKDTGTIQASLKGAQGEALKLGRIKIGAEFATALLTIPTALSAIAPAAAGLTDLGAGAATLVSPLIKVTDLLAGMPALLAPLASVGGSVLGVVSAKGMLEEFGKLDKALADAKLTGDPEQIKAAQEEYDRLAKVMNDKLAPSAKAFSKTMIQFGDGMELIGRQMQQDIWKSFANGAESGLNLLKELTPELYRTNSAVSDVITSLSRKARGDSFISDLKSVAGEGADELRAIGNVVDDLIDSFLDLAVAGQPFADKVMGSLERSAAGLRMWTQLGRETGTINDRLMDGADTLGQYVDIAKDAAVALGNMFRTWADAGGDEMLDGIEDLAQRWRNWTESVGGKNALADWVKDSKPLMSELGKLVGGLVDTFLAVSDAGRPALLEVVELLRTDLLPAIEEVAIASADSGILQALVETGSEMLSLFATIKGGSDILVDMIEWVGDIAGVITDLVDILPGGAELVANLATSFSMLKIIGVSSPIAAGFTLLLALTESLTGSLDLLTPAVVLFGSAMGVLKFQNWADGLGGVAGAAGGAKTNMMGMASTLTMGFNPAVIAAEAAVAIAIGTYMAWDRQQDATKERIDDLTKSVLDGGAAMEEFAGYIDTLREENEGIDQAFKDAGLSSKYLAEVVAATGEDFDKLRDRSDGWSAKSVSGTEMLAASLAMLAGPLASAAVLFQSGQEDWDAYMRTINDGGDDFDAYTVNFMRNLDEMNLGKEQYQDIMDGMAESSKAYSEMLAQLKTDAEVFSAEEGFDQYVAGSDKKRLADVRASGSAEELQEVLSELAAKYPELAEASGMLTDAQMYQAEVQANLTKEWEKGAEQLDAYYGFFEKLIAGGSDFISANEDMLDSQQNVRDQLADNKAAWDAATSGGRSNRDVIRSLYKDYVSLSAAQYEAGDSAENSQQQYGNFLTELEKLQKEGLLPADQSVQDLAASLGLTQGDYIARFNLEIKDDQLLKLEYIKAAAETLGAEGMVELGYSLLIDGNTAEFDKLVADARWVSDLNRNLPVDIRGTVEGDALIAGVREDMQFLMDNPDPKTGVSITANKEALDDVITGLGKLFPDPKSKETQWEIALLMQGKFPAPYKDFPSYYDAMLSGVLDDTATKEITFDGDFDPLQRAVEEWFPPDVTAPVEGDTDPLFKDIKEFKPPKVSVPLDSIGLEDSIDQQFNSIPKNKYKMTIQGEVIGQANGGMFGPPEKRANGYLPKSATIMSPQPNLIQWAEPETHGEAFIPLAPSKRDRSLAIWRETGKRLGAMADGGIINLSLLPNFDKLEGHYKEWLNSAVGALGGAGAQEGSYKAILNYFRTTGVPGIAGSTIRPGATTRGSGNTRTSLHALGRAVDFFAPNGGSDNNELLAIYRAFLPIRNMLTELIYSGPGGSNPRNPITAADHHNHVHVGMADGGIMDWLTPLAAGGVVMKPTAALIGEAGPEAVIPLKQMANGGFTAEDQIGQIAEAMENNWERLVGVMEETNPLAAIKTIYTRMLKDGLKTNSDEWVRMYSRIEALRPAADLQRDNILATRRNMANPLGGNVNQLYGQYLTGAKSNRMGAVDIGARGDFGTSAAVREETFKYLAAIKKAGAQLKETGYGQYQVQIDADTNRAKLADILNFMQTREFSVAQGSAPEAYVQIQTAIFKDENDAEMVGRKVEFAIRTERLS